MMSPKYKIRICLKLILVVSFVILWNYKAVYPQTVTKYGNLFSANGKLYSYIFMLINENPYFVNIITNNSVSTGSMNEGFEVELYRKYVETISDKKLKGLAQQIFHIYNNPPGNSTTLLANIEKLLLQYDIIAKLTIGKWYDGRPRLISDYMIFGVKEKIQVKHPFFSDTSHIYSVKPKIHYDEMTSSNNTFYKDLIYIHEQDVHDDVLVINLILANNKNYTMYLNGGLVNQDVEFWAKGAFAGGRVIEQEVRNIQTIYLLTIKLLESRYPLYDKKLVHGMAMASTIFNNPCLGMSYLHAYNSYKKDDPRYSAAQDLLKYLTANNSNENGAGEKDIKQLKDSFIRQVVKQYFNILYEKHVK